VLLARSRLQRSIQNNIVDFKLALNQRRHAIFDFLGERAKESISNSSVDRPDGFILKVSERKDVKVPLKSESDLSTTTSRRAHRRQNYHVLDLVERLLLGLSLIPALVVHKLSDKLKRWLSTVFPSLAC